MFPFGKFGNAKLPNARRHAPGLEPLERRQLLSGTPGGGHGGGPGGHAPGGPGGGPAQDTIAFSLLPATIQTGLTTLATTDGLADPTDATPVALGNQNGVETYTVTITSTGTVSRLTVDAAGNPVTAPVQSTTTFGDLAPAPAAEITAIAAAKSLTAPTTDTTVNVTTTAAGVVTYSAALSASTDTTTTDDRRSHPMAVMVDADGNPVGNQSLPLSVFPSAVQAALTAGAPTGATALTDTSTVNVRTAGGLTTYAVTYTVDGTDTTVTVDKAGATVAPAAKTTADFSTLPAAAQTELQALATAKSLGTIATDQSVDVYTQVGGTVTLYAVRLSATTTDDGPTGGHGATLVVDANGNPTTLPMGGTSTGSPGGRFDHGGPGGDRGGSDAPTDPTSDGSTDPTTTTPTPTATATATATVSTRHGGSGTAARGPAGRGGNALAAALGGGSPAVPNLGPALSLFASVATDATVAADLATLKADAAALRAAVKGLTASDAATLKADQKAVATAMRALSATLAPAQKTLRSDTAKYAATLRADQQAVRHDRSDATALAADQAQLATDQAAAFAALSADLDALKALISADAGVTAAQSKLATDLPSIATAQATIQTDTTQLEKDVGAALAADATA